MNSLWYDAAAEATSQHRTNGMLYRLDGGRARALVAGAMVLSFLLASTAAVRPWVAQWRGSGAPLDRAARRALSIEPGNDRFRVVLASLYHYSLLLRDYPAALAFYQSALRSNPLDSASWLHLGKLYQKLDRPREADRALGLAVRLAPSDATLLWEATLAYLEEGRLPAALSTLARFISISRDENARTAGYDLAHRIAPPDEVLRSIIEPGVTPYAKYVNYLLDGNRADEAFRVWRRIKEIPAGVDERVDPNLQLRAVDLLMAKGQFGAAHEVWRSLMKEIDPEVALHGSNLISNASFERRDTLGRGFDWRIGGAAGIECDIDASTAFAGRQSLRVSFGKSQAEFSNVYQVTPVQAGSMYTLEAHIRTRGLDGSPGVTVEVIDPPTGLLARTQTVAGTRDWTKVGVTFRTSSKTEAVTVRVHSEPAAPSSIQRSAATAWIDDVSLTKAH